MSWWKSVRAAPAPAAKPFKVRVNTLTQNLRGLDRVAAEIKRAQKAKPKNGRKLR